MFMIASATFGRVTLEIVGDCRMAPTTDGIAESVRPGVLSIAPATAGRLPWLTSGMVSSEFTAELSAAGRPPMAPMAWVMTGPMAAPTPPLPAAARLDAAPRADAAVALPIAVA